MPRERSWYRPRIVTTRRQERGTALVTTLIVMTVMVSLSLVALDRAVSSENFARDDQDWNAALSAAQAGVDDYVHRLNDSNGSYYVWNTGNPDPGNTAMGLAAGKPNWAAVPQGSGTQRAWFHYDIDTTTYTGTSSVVANGSIEVTSTGKVGTRTRSVTASIRRSGFLDKMYFTDFETKDPTIYDTKLDGNTAAWAQANCADKYWDARGTTAARNVNCLSIQFASDTLDGPVHSNDTILICDHATFKRQVTTAYTASAATSNKPYRSNTSGCTTTGTTFTPSANNPKTIASVAMPATNVSLKSFTDPTATPRGCLYVGPTKIVVKGTRIKVTSPWTKPASLPSNCQLGTYFTIPTAGVVYVDAVPSDGTSDPNSWGASEAGKPVCPGSGNNVGFPVATESGWSYPCRSGDVFIEEESGSATNALDGRLTVGSANDLYITDDLDDLNGTSGQSLLGLIANGFIYYWHPVTTTSVTGIYPNATCNGVNVTAANGGKSPNRVAASLVSVLHSVTTQNYCHGADLGTLNLTGSLTQKYRGVVRRGTAGYAKNYLYDSRLAYDAPPHFLDPTTSTFAPSTLRENPTVAYHAG